THAIAEVVRQAKQAKEEGKERVILFNLCGHGYLDLSAYEDYFAGKLTDHELSDTEIQKYLSEIESFPKP
ncbi:MAG: TrpB-like pyridoxal-phosphate dependent enzyme, partial [Leptospiraceae bacterium]|nr:TrpB-like pyridoxal-phosphate dependent enzyme [Leptospiraceae bacterium]